MPLLCVFRCPAWREMAPVTPPAHTQCAHWRSAAGRPAASQGFSVCFQKRNGSAIRHCLVLDAKLCPTCTLWDKHNNLRVSSRQNFHAPLRAKGHARLGRRIPLTLRRPPRSRLMYRGSRGRHGSAWCVLRIGKGRPGPTRSARRAHHIGHARVRASGGSTARLVRFSLYATDRAARIHYRHDVRRCGYPLPPPSRADTRAARRERRRWRASASVCAVILRGRLFRTWTASATRHRRAVTLAACRQKVQEAPEEGRKRHRGKFTLVKLPPAITAEQQICDHCRAAPMVPPFSSSRVITSFLV